MKVVVHRDMLRTHGYAPIGKRCVGNHDWHAKGRTNVIGALLASCLLTATLLTGSVYAGVFFAWLSQDLLPNTQQTPLSSWIMPLFTSGIMQCNSTHRTGGGHTLEFLPPYSPDFSPSGRKLKLSEDLKTVLLTSCLLSFFKSFYYAFTISPCPLV
jgi:hypothetical protein